MNSNKVSNCCNSNGDVRGMCFTCIGDLTKLSYKTIQLVSNCPSKNYAVAYWIWNSHNDEYEKNGLKKFMNLDELNLLKLNWAKINSIIKSFNEDTEDDSIA
jgi:hypothetical protein